MQLLIRVAALFLSTRFARTTGLMVPPVCSVKGLLENASSWANHDLQHMELASATDCAHECCKVPECGGFTFAASVNWQSTECPLGSSCCFLKDLATGKVGHLVPVANATSGLVHSGRHPGSLPERFPPISGWQPVLGDNWSQPVFTANDTWEHDAVQEPQVIFQPENRTLRMWYRGGGWGFPSGVGVADSSDGKTWTRYAGNPVWYGSQPWVFKEAEGKYWLYVTSNGNEPSVHIATSNDGLLWKNCSDGPYVNLPRGGAVVGTLFGNRAVWKEADGTWRMLQECGTSEGVWEIFLYNGKSALEWEVANDGMPLYSLQRHAKSMFGGIHIATVDGEYTPRGPTGLYNVWYHAGANGDLPTDIYHATSTDLINWTVTPATPVLSHRGTGDGFAYDQVADPSPLVADDTAYIVFDGDDNRPGAITHAAIGMGFVKLV